MTHSKINLIPFALLAVIALTAALGLAGCGSDKDSEAPSDPSYYKGEMKGKGSGKVGSAE